MLLLQRIETNSIGEIEVGELRRVLDGMLKIEYLGSFEEDDTVSVDQVVDAILAESAELGEKEFQEAWIEPMRSCVNEVSRFWLTRIGC